MEKTKEKNDLFDLLNKAFSANYTCLRIANQDVPFSGDLVQTRDSIFRKKTLKEHWIRAKMKDAAEQRTELLTAFLKAKEMYFNELDMSMEDKKAKDLLMLHFNRYYQTNKTFEECFDGYEILDEDFKAIFELFDEYKTIPENRLGMSMLLNVYYNYLDYVTDKTFVVATCDIIDTLADDLNSAGYRTFYYNKPRNPRISTISREEIDKLILKTHEILLKFEKESKQKKKEAEVFAKNAKKTHSELATQQYFEHQVALTRYAILEEKLKALSYFLTVLDNRLTATGKDIDDSKILRFGEGFLDLTSGINVFDDNNRLKVNHTYIHDLERKHLTFLFKSIGYENPLDSQQEKTDSTKQKQ